jgi:hypothetical protein
MAARHLGFPVEPTRNWSNDERDFCNAWLGITSAAGDYPQ